MMYLLAINRFVEYVHNHPAIDCRSNIVHNSLIAMKLTLK